MIIKTAQEQNTRITFSEKALLSKLPLYFSLLTSLFFIPKVSGQDISAPRFFEINVQPTSTNQSPNFPDLQSGIVPPTQPNYNVQAALKFPIKLKGNTKIIGELKHKNEFLNGYYSLDNERFEQLRLRQSKGSIIVLSQLNDRWKFTNMLSASSNSTDYISTNTRAIRWRNISVFEKELKNGSTIGFGGSLAYDQNFSFLPVFKYETEFGNQWKLDMVLPKEIEVSKYLSKRSCILFRVKGSGSNYTLGSQEVANTYSSSSIYKRIDVAGSIGYERQITPWIGFSVHAGATMPIRSGIYANDSNQTKLHELNEGVQPYFRVGMFVSFPR